MIDWNLVSNIVVAVMGIAMAVGGYLYRQLKSDNEAVKIKGDKTFEDLLNYKLHCSEKYITKDHLAAAVDQLHKTLENVAASMVRVETRLNNQIDNSNARKQP